MENTLAIILGKLISDKPLSPSKGILYHVEGIDLIPSNIELSGLEVTLNMWCKRGADDFGISS